MKTSATDSSLHSRTGSLYLGNFEVVVYNNPSLTSGRPVRCNSS
jgi:hypothetical protein